MIKRYHINKNKIIHNNHNIPKEKINPKEKIIYNISFNDDGEDFVSTEMSVETFQNAKRIKLPINNENIVFKKIEKKGFTSFYFVDDEKKYFLKIPYRCLTHDILKRELFILEKLKKYNRFPKVVYSDTFSIVLEYIGEVIKKQTIPIDILFQINEINNILKKEKIKHTDIKLDEMLIKDNHLFLVDFGWATYNNLLSCSNGFSSKEKPGLDKETDINNMISIVIKLMNE
jgi:predicted Ser/Thr protein kinase